MGLFRPYERKTAGDADDVPTMREVTPGARSKPETPAETTKRLRRQSMVAGGATRTAENDRATPTAQTAPVTDDIADATEAPQVRTRGPQPKGAPTPSRKQAEAARRERLNPSLTPKQSRQLSAANNREARMKSMAAQESTPEKVLLRDWIDRRFRLGEFLLPVCVVILALTFLGTSLPQISFLGTAVLYLFILATLVDYFLTWRGYRKVLAERVPNANTRGLLFYGLMRTLQIRRFRMPRPRLKRGADI